MNLKESQDKSNYSDYKSLGSIQRPRKIQKQAPNRKPFVLPESPYFKITRHYQVRHNHCSVYRRNEKYYEQYDQIRNKRITDENNESQPENNERQPSLENHLERSRQKISKRMKRAERDILIQKQRAYGQQTFNMALFILRTMSQRQSKRQLTSLFIDGQYRTEVGISHKGTSTKGLLIYNSHGSIRFEDPINLMKFQKKRLCQLVQISQRDIKIHEPELMHKLCCVQFQDYYGQGENTQTQLIKNMEQKCGIYTYYATTNKATFNGYKFMP